MIALNKHKAALKRKETIEQNGKERLRRRRQEKMEIDTTKSDFHVNICTKDKISIHVDIVGRLDTIFK